MKELPNHFEEFLQFIFVVESRKASSVLVESHATDVYEVHWHANLVLAVQQISLHAIFILQYHYNCTVATVALQWFLSTLRSSAENSDNVPLVRNVELGYIEVH